MYRENNTSIRPPVRVHADRNRDSPVLQSDVPVSPSEAPKFAVCPTDWITDHDITPVYLSDLPTGDETTAEEVYGVAVGGALMSTFARTLRRKLCVPGSNTIGTGLKTGKSTRSTHEAGCRYQYSLWVVRAPRVTFRCRS